MAKTSYHRHVFRGVVGLVVLCTMLWLYTSTTAHDIWVALPAFAGTTVVAVYEVIVRIREGPTERARRRAKRANAVRKCTKCGYILKGLALPRCPECGRAIGFTKTFEELGVTKEELRERPVHEEGDAPP